MLITTASTTSTTETQLFSADARFLYASDVHKFKTQVTFTVVRLKFVSHDCEIMQFIVQLWNCFYKVLLILTLSLVNTVLKWHIWICYTQPTHCISNVFSAAFSSLRVSVILLVLVSIVWIIQSRLKDFSAIVLFNFNFMYSSSVNG